MTGTWNFILGAAVGIYTHMLPGFIMGYYLVSTTTVSEFVAAMERMRDFAKGCHPRIGGVPFFPHCKRRICSNSGCNENERHYHIAQPYENVGISCCATDDVDSKNWRRTVCCRFDHAGSGRRKNGQIFAQSNSVRWMYFSSC